MYTYLLENKQGQYETTTLTFETRRRAERDAEMWARQWLNLTGRYVVLQIKNFKKVTSAA